jgi:hypothetical protein
VAAAVERPVSGVQEQEAHLLISYFIYFIHPQLVVIDFWKGKIMVIWLSSTDHRIHPLMVRYQIHYLVPLHLLLFLKVQDFFLSHLIFKN